jgi:predicted DNA-binding transcriptional regulator YafY
VLPSRLRHRVNALQSVTVPLRMGGPTVGADDLTLIGSACRDFQRLRFDYRDHDGTDTVRDVEPYRLVHTGRRWYLIAFDVHREDWRTFRIDRMQPKANTGPRFAPRDPPDTDIAAYTSWVISTAGRRYHARFTMHAPMEVVADRVPPTSGLVEPIDENTCSLKTGSNSLDGLAVYVGLIGVDFEVHEPPELVERMTALAQRMTRSVSAGGS